MSDEFKLGMLMGISLSSLSFAVTLFLVRLIIEEWEKDKNIGK